MNDKTNRKTHPDDIGDRDSANRDAITGTPGSHPVGTGIGAASAGAAGAAIGSAIGPVGTVAGAAIGAVVGAVAGGLAGKGVAEAINPTAEDAYWRENYRSRPYAIGDTSYEKLQPAYRYGWESSARYQGKRFAEVESDLRSNWEKSNPGYAWDSASPVIRDSFDRVTSRRAGGSMNAKM
jgi:hypothetical protein